MTSKDGIEHSTEIAIVFYNRVYVCRMFSRPYIEHKSMNEKLYILQSISKARIRAFHSTNSVGISTKINANKLYIAHINIECSGMYTF